VASSAPDEPLMVMPPPARPAQARVPPSVPPESVNLSGEWTVLNTVAETSYPPFQQLRLGFRVTVRQDGQAFQGVGEKQRENGRWIPVSARRPLRLQGTIADGAVIAATFQEEGASRLITGHFRLRRQDRHRLTGTFASTAAQAKGPSQWIRTSSQVAPTSRHDQRGRGARLVAPPEPRSDMGPLPALTEEPLPTPKRKGPATAPGLRGARQPGTRIASRPDEPRKSARPGAPADQRPTPQRRPQLQPGMTQAEVRDLLGEPTSVEASAGFVFWHYGTEAHEQEVVFEQGTERVHGWLGFSGGLAAGSSQ
jgi:SmpA / OmlA family